MPFPQEVLSLMVWNHWAYTNNVAAIFSEFPSRNNQHKYEKRREEIGIITEEVKRKCNYSRGWCHS